MTRVGNVLVVEGHAPSYQAKKRVEDALTGRLNGVRVINRLRVVPEEHIAMAE